MQHQQWQFAQQIIGANSNLSLDDGIDQPNQQQGVAVVMAHVLGMLVESSTAQRLHQIHDGLAFHADFLG